ncbi:36.4 kDa proline-rich protein-like, partial [Vigna umbellata]|uniref:36.4 kDa proline-rich protein-like n=1 Tax=Vigna umbellata TaxID=87088 RepID=UPI001F5E4677
MSNRFIMCNIHHRNIDKRGWAIAIQTKPRGRIDPNEVEEDVAYQLDQMSQPQQIIEVERITTLHDPDVMIEEGSECRDKGKGVARPKKRERKAPKYVLRVHATLPITAAPSSSSVGPSPTPVVHPLPTHVVHPPPTPTIYPPLTPITNILPPPVIITLTPPPMIITPTSPSDPTYIPSSSSIPPYETATPSVDPDLAGDGDGVNPPLHDRPWIEPYGLFHP